MRLTALRQPPKDITRPKQPRQSKRKKSNVLDPPNPTNPCVKNITHSIAGTTNRENRNGVQYDLTVPRTLTCISLSPTTLYVNASPLSHSDSPHNSSRILESSERKEGPRHSVQGFGAAVRRHAPSREQHLTPLMKLPPFAYSPLRPYSSEETCDRMQPLRCNILCCHISAIFPSTSPLFLPSSEKKWQLVAALHLLSCTPSLCGFWRTAAALHLPLLMPFTGTPRQLVTSPNPFISATFWPSTSTRDTPPKNIRGVHPHNSRRTLESKEASGGLRHSAHGGWAVVRRRTLTRRRRSAPTLTLNIGSIRGLVAPPPSPPILYMHDIIAPRTPIRISLLPLLGSPKHLAPHKKTLIIPAISWQSAITCFSPSSPPNFCHLLAAHDSSQPLIPPPFHFCHLLAAHDN